MKLSDTSKRTKIAFYISSICLFMSVAILLTTLTYSWIRRTWVSSVYEEKIKIEANGSLAFKLKSDDDVARDSLSILNILNYKDFVFKPVSNFSGKSDDFFTVDRTTENTEKYLHLMPPNGRIESSAYQELGKNYGYIEFRFLLVGDEERVNENNENGNEEIKRQYTKYVFLDAGSFFDAYDPDALQVNPADALRVSISVVGDNNHTYLFKKPDAQGGMLHTAVNNAKDTSDTGTVVWKANGANFRNEDHEEATTFTYGGETLDIVKTCDALSLDQYDGGIYKKDGKFYITPGKCLGWFSPGGQMWVSVRIWLEGTDPVCKDDIAGQRLKLYLNHEAHQTLQRGVRNDAQAYDFRRTDAFGVFRPEKPHHDEVRSRFDPVSSRAHRRVRLSEQTVRRGNTAIGAVYRLGGLLRRSRQRPRLQARLFGRESV